MDTSLPKKQSDADYAGFSIAGTSALENKKTGLLIALTRFDRAAL